jgi:hypothetical protein
MTFSLRIPFIALAFLALHASTVFSQSDADDRNWQALQSVARKGVAGSGDHVGNVFLQGEAVTVPIPKDIEAVHHWQVSDETERQIDQGAVANRESGCVELGKLPIGWYRIGLLDSDGKEIGWTTAAVLARLAAPTPQDSPICVDSATAWFAKDDPVEQERLTRLAALAGVNWVRDRMRWRDIQPTENKFAGETTYDTSAAFQYAYGLKILQVFHDTPPWAAGENSRGRFPTDLRHVYRLGKAMSQRFHGRVQAWEPWNEANVATFGGHTMDEICSYQKAAWLGLKAADPNVTVCWNATTATPTERQTDTVLLNETWSYFDTFNIHTYDWAHDYERLWTPTRRAACGKPLWITESDRGMKSEPSSPTHDLSAVNRRLKAQYVTQSYVKSLHAGAHRHFHFILGQYGEGETQFGLLRHDMTPRPGYVALATLGRFLAAARCLGRLEQSDAPDLHVYAFRSRPDGEERDVLVAWTERNVDWPDRGKATYTWKMPEGLTPDTCFDYLGRKASVVNPITLTAAPVFLLLAKGQCDELTLTRPAESPRRVDRACPIVLQCAMPQGTAQEIKRIPWASEYEYHIEAGTPCRVPIYAYNFGSEVVRGTVGLEGLPAGCTAEPTEWEVEIEPMGRVELPVKITITKEMTAETDDIWITLRGEFGAEGRPVLAFRLVAEQSG